MRVVAIATVVFRVRIRLFRCFILALMQRTAAFMASKRAFVTASAAVDQRANRRTSAGRRMQTCARLVTDKVVHVLRDLVAGARHDDAVGALLAAGRLRTERLQWLGRAEEMLHRSHQAEQPVFLSRTLSIEENLGIAASWTCSGLECDRKHSD